MTPFLGLTLEAGLATPNFVGYPNHKLYFSSIGQVTRDD